MSESESNFKYVFDTEEVLEWSKCIDKLRPKFHPLWEQMQTLIDHPPMDAPDPDPEITSFFIEDPSKHLDYLAQLEATIQALRKWLSRFSRANEYALKYRKHNNITHLCINDEDVETWSQNSVCLWCRFSLYEENALQYIHWGEVILRSFQEAAARTGWQPPKEKDKENVNNQQSQQPLVTNNNNQSPQHRNINDNGGDTTYTPPQPMNPPIQQPNNNNNYQSPQLSATNSNNNQQQSQQQIGSHTIQAQIQSDLSQPQPQQTTLDSYQQSLYNQLDKSHHTLQTFQNNMRFLQAHCDTILPQIRTLQHQLQSSQTATEVAQPITVPTEPTTPTPMVHSTQRPMVDLTQPPMLDPTYSTYSTSIPPVAQSLHTQLQQTQSVLELFNQHVRRFQPQPGLVQLQVEYALLDMQDLSVVTP